jgi:UDP-N-acetylmuramoylalanine--D-glutamate ligase
LRTEKISVEIKGKRVLIVGLGKSGVAAALFMQARGARVTVSDAKAEDELQLRGDIPQLLEKGIAVETGGHGERTFRNQDLIVVSPGVPINVPHLEQARALGIPVVGEIELASNFLPGHIVAITGSNGKTTTTALCGEVLSAGGLPKLVGGNIGTPAISFVGKATPETYIVLEVSSFQLETIRAFHPEIAVVLNVTPDHLDRHGSMDTYIAAKARVFENQSASDHAVLNADDTVCLRLGRHLPSRLHWFSRKQEVTQGAFIRRDQIIWRDAAGERAVMGPGEMKLKGAHNLENVLAAVCVGMILKCEPAKIRRAVQEFNAVEHRLEYVASVNGVQYYNDSKATNVDATIKALESFPGNIHLILGGKDKGSPYTVLNDLLRERVKRVYTIGAAAPKIQSQLSSAAPITAAETLENAVRRAAQAASPGDIVLLAPACASFDQFQSYEHRGQVFKELVRALASRKEAVSERR